jgi:hypothetical protein
LGGRSPPCRRGLHEANGIELGLIQDKDAVSAGRQPLSLDLRHLERQRDGGDLDLHAVCADDRLQNLKRA